MKIAFLSPSVSRRAGGIFEIERSLALGLSALPDTHLEVFGLEDEFSAVDAVAWGSIRPKVHPTWGLRAFGYSPRLARDFMVCTADIAHLHSLWMYTSPLIRRWAKRHRTPYVTTLNGMLDPWALANAREKKRLATFFYEDRALQDASCIQVNSEAELAAARDFGLKGPFCLLPNGVVAPAADLTQIPDVNHPILSGKMGGAKVLLYLGRLHPKKGLSNLLEALSRVRDDEWILAIAGWDQTGHERTLRGQCEELALGKRVIFLGPQFEEGKAACFRYADAFVLPSYSEGLPMAVLEAWSYAKPVLMTPACNLPVGFSEYAAISIDPNPESIAAGLRQLFAMSDSERAAMGERGRVLTLRSFDWHVISQHMRAVYAWLIGAGDRPVCIVDA